MTGTEKQAETCSRRTFLGAIAAGSVVGLAALGLGETSSAAWATPQYNGQNASRSKVSSLSNAAPTRVSAPDTATRMRSLAPYSKPAVTTFEERASNPKRVLVVVDYQVDFVNGGVFGRIEPAMAIEQALCDRIEEYLAAGDIVIYTMDTHPQDDYENTREGAVNPPHCVPGTEGWELYGRVRDLLNPSTAIRLLKGTYGSPDLPFVVSALQAQGANVASIEIAGVSTTCRVLHNAILLYTYLPELPIIFDERTTAGYTDERTREQLDELEGWGFIVRRAS